VRANRVVIKDGMEVNKFDLEVDRRSVRVMDDAVEYDGLRPKPDGDKPFMSVAVDLDSPMVERTAGTCSRHSLTSWH